MSDLTNEVLSQLDPASIAKIASQLGIGPEQARAAVGQAVPVLLGGLARNARDEQGASALQRALGDHAGLDLGAVLGSVLGGGGDGGAILGHVFGAQRGRVAEGLGQSSGIGAAGAGQLMAMLAPLIMGVLGRRTQAQGSGNGGLGSMLGRELQGLGQSKQGGLLASILDQDGDGQLGLGDLLKVGASMFGSSGRSA